MDHEPTVGVKAQEKMCCIFPIRTRCGEAEFPRIRAELEGENNVGHWVRCCVVLVSAMVARVVLLGMGETLCVGA